VIGDMGDDKVRHHHQVRSSITFVFEPIMDIPPGARPSTSAVPNRQGGFCAWEPRRKSSRVYLRSSCSVTVSATRVSKCIYSRMVARTCRTGLLKATFTWRSCRRVTKGLMAALYPMHVLAILPPRHRLARNRVLEIADVANHPLLLRGPGGAAMVWFAAACQITHIKPRVVFESGAPHTLIELAKTDLVSPSCPQPYGYRVPVSALYR